MRPIPSAVSLVLFLCLFGAAFAEQDYTTRNEPVLSVSVQEKNRSLSLFEGDSFNVSAKASCMNASCNTVDLYLFYCSGLDCSEFRAIPTDSFYPLYSLGDSSHTCLMVDRGQTCSHTWEVRAKRAGSYVLLFFAQSPRTSLVKSEAVYVSVSGCGDGLCVGGETVASCAKDCCEQDCTAVGESLCLSRCSGYSNCSVDPDCVGKASGYRSCVTNASYISCCGEGIKRCDYGAYCMLGYCVNCSTRCDGACESPVCFRVDPDCDSSGLASLACCGNDVINPGEECDGEMDFCPGGCAGNCRCASIVVEATTQPTASSTASTLRDEAAPAAPETSVPQTTMRVVVTGSVRESQMDKILSLALLVIALGLIALLIVFMRLRKAGDVYDGLKDREDEIAKARTKVYTDYSAGVINEDEASKLILGFDKELEELKPKIAKMEKRAFKE